MDVIMPQLGETVDSGTVTLWLKKLGDEVKQDEPLFEVETEKVSTEIPASVDGVLSEILIAAGETVKVGVKLAVITTGDRKVAGRSFAMLANEAAASFDEPSPSALPVYAVALPSKSREHTDRFVDRADGARLSPAVRRLVAENKIEVRHLKGTGKRGRVTRADVLACIELSSAMRPTSASVPTPDTAQIAERVATPDAVEIIPFNTMRKRIAEHMVRSKAISPHVLQAVEADFVNVERARIRHAAQWNRDEGYSLTFLPFIARAVCLAIREYPRINATVDDDRLLIHQRINLAIAVDLNHEGLLAPVIKRADEMSVKDLARAINGLATRARANQLQADDLTGATYTLSNSGSFGTLITAPIINQPQVAILSTDGVRRKPVVLELDGGESIAIRPIGVLAQSFDHRAIDGAYSASFLRALRGIIEKRDWAMEL